MQTKEWLRPVRAVFEIEEVTGKEITVDQWEHWIGSGHLSCVKYEGRTPLVHEEVVRRVGRLWAAGGKGYLPFYHGEETLYPTALVGDILGVTRREVGRLILGNRLEGQMVGYRKYVTRESLAHYISPDSSWRLNPDPPSIISDIIIQQIYSGSEMLRTGSQVDSGG